MNKLSVVLLIGTMILGSFAGCTIPAEFEVNSLTATPAQVVAGEPVVIEAGISNVGGSRGVYTASLTVDGRMLDVRDITVAPGATKKVSFTCYLETLGEHTIQLGGLTTTVTTSTPKTAKFEVSSLAVTPSEVVSGEIVKVSADVTNIEEVEGTHEVVLTIDNKTVDTEEVSVAGGQTEKVSFYYITESPGLRHVELNGLNEILTVLKPAQFEVKSLSIEPGVVLPGKEAIVSANISNVGEVKGTYTAMLRVNGVEVGTREITLTAATQETVNFSLVQNTAGVCEIDVGGATGSLMVLAVETYTSPTHRFSFSHPAEWELDTSMLPSASFDYQKTAGISVIVLEDLGLSGDAEADLETILPIWLHDMESSTPDYQELSRTKATHNNMPAYLVEFSSLWEETESESKSKGKMIITIKERIAFVVLGIVRESDNKAYWPLVETCMETFQHPPLSKIIFASSRDDNEEIYVMDTDGSNQTRLTNNSAADSNPAWSPDGTKIAFHSYRDGNWQIYIMNADGSNQTRLTNSLFSDSNPAWSPDGTKIAFHSNRNGNEEIYVMNSNSSNQTRLTNSPFSDSNPAWSPDGTKIAFHSNRDGNWQIYIMNADGSNQTRLTNSPFSDSNPAWSPDGTKIAFMSDRCGYRAMYVMNANGTNQTYLTICHGIDNYPAWSPDGTRIAFHSEYYGIDEIFVINADGTNRVWLTDDFALGDCCPAWR